MDTSTPQEGPESDATDGAGIRKGGVAAVGAASIFSAFVLYVVLLVGSRLLTTESNTLLITWISAYQLGTGLLTGLATELTRSVAAGRRRNGSGAHGLPAGAGDAGARPRVVEVAGVTALAVVAAIGLSLPLWWSASLAPGGWGLAWVLCLGLAAYAGHASLSGALAGAGRWTGVARVTFAEAGLKLLLVGVAVLIGATLFNLTVAVAAAAAAWLILLVSADVRACLALRVDQPAARMVPRVAAAVGSQGASAVLTVGFPLLLALTTPADQFAGSAGLLLAISLTRAPLMIPLGAFQSMAVAWFVHTTRPRGQVLTLLALLLAAVGVVGAGIAWLIGPWLMRALFTYDVAPAVLAWLTLAAAVLALLSLVGALCQATDRHVFFLSGWVVALAAALACLVPAGDLGTRAISALLVGPTVGTAWMAIGLLRRSSAAG